MHYFFVFLVLEKAEGLPQKASNMGFGRWGWEGMSLGDRGCRYEKGKLCGAFQGLES
jgi:hypothetical protein